GLLAPWLPSLSRVSGKASRYGARSALFAASNLLRHRFPCLTKSPDHHILLGFRCAERTSEACGMVALQGVTLHAGEDADQGGLGIPPRTADHLMGAGLRALRVVGRAFLVVKRIVPVGDLFLDVAVHIIGAIGPLPGCWDVH